MGATIPKEPHQRGSDAPAGGGLRLGHIPARPPLRIWGTVRARRGGLIDKCVVGFRGCVEGKVVGKVLVRLVSIGQARRHARVGHGLGRIGSRAGLHWCNGQLSARE